MKKDLLCSLDIGSSFLRAALCRVQKGNPLIVACEKIKTQGVEKGRVSDLLALTESIQNILSKIASKSDKNIKKVIVGINGDYIKGRVSPAAIAFSEKTSRYVKNADIKHIRKQSVLLGIRLGDKLLHEVPQEYILDEEHRTINPLGLLARKLSIQSYILTAPYTVLDNILNAVERAGFETGEIAFSSLASNLCVLNKEQKKKGVILLEIGARFTNILFFRNGVLHDYAMIPFGGDDITEDISKGLNIVWNLAEELKKSHLILSARQERYFDNIVIKSAQSYTTIQRQRLLEAAKNKIEIFLDQINNVIMKRMPQNSVECGIVCIGGSAHLEGLLEKIEATVGMSVTLGRINVNSTSGQSVNLEFASAIGLICHRAHLYPESSLRQSFRGDTLFRKTTNFLHKLYHDYF